MVVYNGNSGRSNNYSGTSFCIEKFFYGEEAFKFQVILIGG